MDKAAQGDRVTVKELVYHQALGEEPTQSMSVFSRLCETKEEVWDRRLTVGNDWQPLVSKHCWIEEPGMVLIENLAGAFQHVIPTEEERQAEEAKVLEVGVDGHTVIQVPFSIIPAEASIRIWIEDLTKFHIRCRSGETKYKVTVLPR